MLNEKIDLVFQGADQRRSRYDVIYPNSDAKLPLLIFCHGFKGYKDWGHFPLLCREFAKNGLAVVKFNFSHNGMSLNSKHHFDDLPAFAENNYLKELDDISLLLDLLESKEEYKELIDFGNISILGHSRGGSMAILAGLEDRRIKRIIGWAAVADLVERLPAQEQMEDWKEKGVRYVMNGRTGQDMPVNYQFIEHLYANSKKLSLEKQLKKASKPLLAIQGEDDEAVPLEHLYAIQVWYPKAEVLSIEGAGHTFGGTHPYEHKEFPKDTQVAFDTTIDFLKRHSGLGSSR
ncbi:MAG: hypothetical protein CMP59_04380 [Flavobacteriales bacterium]|nr:hypothetical protein [Flavobacteriales bacterium]|tara:strand:+ start:94 stop:963 length:870 start_codon:yes stop_codon:yes gene_type:complete